MSANDDIDWIRRQEAELVFDAFDEGVAFDLGAAVRARALAQNLPVVVDIRTFDRPLFYAALPGSDASNPDWTRRKINVVRRFLRSSYRMVLEQGRPDRTFKPGEGLDVSDYVLAGGGFPITVRNAGVIGAIAVSGLPERDDHAVTVDALCDHLGRSRDELALPAASD
ncbi:heme-degrading domain-containing protein [Mesorhizobium sp. SP-1A]|uniref:heme-degrading domain-containing protein n=1 Tax=Mesorhizobium sp. SP-1A TaxID=3077840 RepID=UPI0028F73AAF|nr:heme-degrading domain-containing protein [Mesorhizobium sp. SP-1A]